jgi:hypothetical protein
MAPGLKELFQVEFKTVREVALRRAISQAEPARAFSTKVTKILSLAKVLI